MIGRQIQLPLAAGNQHGYQNIAGDVDRGARHVEDPVDPGDQCYPFQRQSHCGQRQRQQHQAGARRARRADAGQGGDADDGQVIHHVQIHPEGLGHEKSRYP